MSNNPPDVIIHLSLADATMLREDCEVAMAQLLGLLNEAERKEYAEKLARLLEFKKNVLEATRIGLMD